MSNIIFDFDGTIADSFAVVVGIIHELTHQEKSLSSAEIERLRGMTLLQAAREVRVPARKIPFLVAAGRQRMRVEMDAVPVFAGMSEVVKTLHDAGHNLYIMSSNSVQNIEVFLKRHDMNTKFIKIYGGIGLLGKARILKKVLRQNNLDTGETYYIGDEVRDVEAAKRAGLKMIAVTWGYNNMRALGNHDPDFLVTTPAELAALFAGPQK